MKRNSLFLGLALVASIALVSCKSSESNYRKAYEKAKAEEQNRQETEPVAVTPVVTPVQTQPTQTVNQDVSNLRQEKLNVQNGGVLKAFNVVCGSFKSLDNANNLRNTLVNQGYSAQVAQNPDTGMYRVIASSFDDRNSAETSRNALRAKYPDAWLLYRTY
ncbi:MAG: SPOR domain-containing protein [Bacteroidaceae bacterium]|jgi:cell division septation protein DedD|nr:SPOR domain-containing protein [Bacteroidaceae bacterium]